MASTTPTMNAIAAKDQKTRRHIIIKCYASQPRQPDGPDPGTLFAVDAASSQSLRTMP
jgi:hypothetical protein